MDGNSKGQQCPKVFVTSLQSEEKPLSWKTIKTPTEIKEIAAIDEIVYSGQKLFEITNENDLTLHHGKNNKCLSSQFQKSEIANLFEAQRNSATSISFARSEKVGSSQKDLPQFKNSSTNKTIYSRGFSMSSNTENDLQEEIPISVELKNIDNPLSIGLQILDKKIDQEAKELNVSYSNLLSKVLNHIGSK